MTVGEDRSGGAEEGSGEERNESNERAEDRNCQEPETVHRPMLETWTVTATQQEGSC